jgi:ectoine hydroxylase-related dioxygenase (phytanoyl-CoA dioxygenase family)
MQDEQVLSYGVLESRRLKDDLDAHVEEIEFLGYTVVESGLTREEIGALRASIDVNYERQLAETANVAMAADADILRCPLAYDDRFLKVATLAPLMAICERLLGVNFVLLQQNAIINRPSSKEFQSRWHRDLVYQHFVSSKKLALNALLCIDDFSIETGGTVVLPGSHVFEVFPSTRLVKNHERTADAKSGSLLILDAMLFHRSGLNKTQNNRRGVNHVIGRPLLAQQIDLPRLLDGRHADDPFLRRYLGYQWNPASSVTTWRAARTDSV